MTDHLQKSARQAVAERLAELISTGDLNSPYGGDVAKSNRGRPHYSVAFSQPRNLDGTVQVYGENFIMVRFMTRYQYLPHKGKFIFNNETDAGEFLTAAFIDHDEVRVDAVLEKARV